MKEIKRVPIFLKHSVESKLAKFTIKNVLSVARSAFNLCRDVFAITNRSRSIVILFLVRMTSAFYKIV